MRVAFIQPPSWHLTNIRFNINRPLAGPQLAAVLNRAGHQATFLDAEALGWMPAQVARYLVREQPQVVAFTVLYHNRHAIAEAMALSRVTLPGVRILAGGPYATSNPGDVLDMGADAVCVGEGEMEIEDLVQAGNGIIPGRKPADLNGLPVPDYAACTPEESAYGGNNPVIGYPEAISLWARGCPHTCNFCSNPVFCRQRPRVMSAFRVVDELQALKKRGVKSVFVYSDELVGSSSWQDAWLEEVCDVITKSTMRLRYKTQGRCSSHISQETLEAMAAAGFQVVMWGIESISQKVLDNLHKRLRVEEIWHTLRMAKKSGLRSYGFFMVGGIDETEADFEETLQAAREMYREGLLTWHQVSVMTVEPGCELWARAVSDNWLPQSSPTVSHFAPYLNLPWADQQELLRRQRLLQEVISPAIRRTQ